MANPIFNALGGNMMPGNNMLAQFQQFRQRMKGVNPHEEINKLLEGKNSSIGSEHLVYLLDKLIPQLKVTVIVDKPTCQMNSRVTENGVLVDDFKKEVSINPYAAAYRHFTNLLKVYNEKKKTKKRK